jgi:hypothetical protein
MTSVALSSSIRKAITGGLVWIERVAWALFLFCLPITSFPYFPPALGGGALVRPLSVFPLLVLVCVATLPRLATKPLPKTFLCLAPFIVAATASSLISLLRGIEPALGVTVTDRIVRGLLTLGLGLSMYITVALIPRSAAELRGALRWLYAGFGLALLWGSAQAVYMVHFNPTYFQWLGRLQGFVSSRKLFPNRISGMTYEPNWFAEQITFLLMPWLVASVLTGVSAFRLRWRWLTVEWLLLGWSVAVLAFTFSRAGFINLFILAIVSLLFFRPKRLPRSDAPRAVVPWRASMWARRGVEALLVVAVLGGGLYLAGAKNAFFARIWNYWTSAKEPTLTGYFEYLGFNARFIYSDTAFNTYQAYPVFGVGLGNYAFYFEEMLPDQPLAATPEVLRIITPDPGRDRLITAKNFYYRLLAETGLVGLGAFLVFIIALLGSGLWLWLSPQPEERFWGLASLLGLIVFVPAALSFDSFAVPNMWIVFGFITAAARLYVQTEPQAAALSEPLQVAS